MNQLYKFQVLFLLIVIGFCIPANVHAQDELEPTVIEITPHNQSPLFAPSTLIAPVSLLQFDPRVDVQSRNMLEAQGDISVRGGIFENSGFALGALNLFDPQTGHYFAEIPVSAFMLGDPRVLTGKESAVQGFNSSVATIAYDFRPITDRAVLRLGLGEFDTRIGQAYAGAEDVLNAGSEHKLGFDFEVGQSESDGSVDDGDHDFQRVSGRAQLLGDQYQTDLVLGYQDKYFQWPYLYAVRELHELVGSSGIESESIRTTLYAINHKQRLDDGSVLDLGAYYRRNTDNYEFDISQPGLFNPFEHETKVYGANAGGTFLTSFGNVRLSSQFIADEIESTALTFGDFQSRSYLKNALVPTVVTEIDESWNILISAGLVHDYSNRNRRSFSPVSRIALAAREKQLLRELYLEHARSTQLPGYTAIGSNPDGGLFRGNQDLAREISNNYELGAVLAQDQLVVRSAVFYRRDNNLVDWTFNSSSPSFAARFANNVDVNTLGAESFAQYSVEKTDLSFGYVYLSKQSDYGDELVDASFYALNFPKHRMIFSLSTAVSDEVGLRFDNEYRRQIENSLRNSSREFFLSSAAVTWQPGFMKDFEWSVVGENIFDREFEEVPGVPGRRRLVSVFLTYRG
jgi:hypothetical protein